MEDGVYLSKSVGSEKGSPRGKGWQNSEFCQTHA